MGETNEEPNTFTQQLAPRPERDLLQSTPASAPQDVGPADRTDAAISTPSVSLQLQSEGQVPPSTYSTPKGTASKTPDTFERPVERKSSMIQVHGILEIIQTSSDLAPFGLPSSLSYSNLFQTQASGRDRKAAPSAYIPKASLFSKSRSMTRGQPTELRTGVLYDSKRSKTVGLNGENKTPQDSKVVAKQKSFVLLKTARSSSLGRLTSFEKFELDTQVSTTGQAKDVKAPASKKIIPESVDARSTPTAEGVAKPKFPAPKLPPKKPVLQREKESKESPESSAVGPPFKRLASLRKTVPLKATETSPKVVPRLHRKVSVEFHRWPRPSAGDEALIRSQSMGVQALKNSEKDESQPVDETKQMENSSPLIQKVPPPKVPKAAPKRILRSGEVLPRAPRQRSLMSFQSSKSQGSSHSVGGDRVSRVTVPLVAKVPKNKTAVPVRHDDTKTTLPKRSVPKTGALQKTSPPVARGMGKTALPKKQVNAERRKLSSLLEDKAPSVAAAFSERSSPRGAVSGVRTKLSGVSLHKSPRLQPSPARPPLRRPSVVTTASRKPAPLRSERESRIQAPGPSVSAGAETSVQQKPVKKTEKVKTEPRPLLAAGGSALTSRKQSSALQGKRGSSVRGIVKSLGARRVPASVTKLSQREKAKAATLPRARFTLPRDDAEKVEEPVALLVSADDKDTHEMISGVAEEEHMKVRPRRTSSGVISESKGISRARTESSLSGSTSLRQKVEGTQPPDGWPVSELQPPRFVAADVPPARSARVKEILPHPRFLTADIPPEAFPWELMHQYVSKLQQQRSHVSPPFALDAYQTASPVVWGDSRRHVVDHVAASPSSFPVTWTPQALPRPSRQARRVSELSRRDIQQSNLSPKRYHRHHVRRRPTVERVVHGYPESAVDESDTLLSFGSGGGTRVEERCVCPSGGVLSRICCPPPPSLSSTRDGLRARR